MTIQWRPDRLVSGATTCALEEYVCIGGLDGM